MANNSKREKQLKQSIKEENAINDTVVKVPVEDNGKEFKTYKIIKKLVIDNVEKGKSNDSGYATKSNRKKRKRGSEKHKNPFWLKRDGYYQNKEDADLIYIKGKGKMSKEQAINNNLIEV